MAKRKSVMIVAYGTPEDREKLALVAEASGETSSGWLLKQLRDAYDKLVRHQQGKN